MSSTFFFKSSNCYKLVKAGSYSFSLSIQTLLTCVLFVHFVLIILFMCRNVLLEYACVTVCEPGAR